MYFVVLYLHTWQHKNLWYFLYLILIWYVTPVGHNILIPSQPISALSPQWCVLSGEAAKINYIVFGITPPGLEPTIYRTRGEHAIHYTTDVVQTVEKTKLLIHHYKKYVVQIMIHFLLIQPHINQQHKNIKHIYIYIQTFKHYVYALLCNSNMRSFFRFVDKRAIYRWYNLICTCAGECDWLFHLQHKLCATFSANVDINYRLPIKAYYRICTLRHIRIEIDHGSQNVFWVLTWIGGY